MDIGTNKKRVKTSHHNYNKSYKISNLESYTVRKRQQQRTEY